jgi:hypothetical protein
MNNIDSYVDIILKFDEYVYFRQLKYVRYLETVSCGLFNDATSMSLRNVGL